ncbi:MAG: hypothetical protein ACOWWM_11655 [Desulfobacterales bacterium]
MKELFSNLLNMKGVRGLVLFSAEGEILFDAFPGAEEAEVRSFGNWEAVSAALAGVREADLLFQNGRFYIRRTGIGILLVVIDLSLSVAMVKLNCDIILPNLKQVSSGKGLRRFFRK